MLLHFCCGNKMMKECQYFFKIKYLCVLKRKNMNDNWILLQKYHATCSQTTFLALKQRAGLFKVQANRR